MLLAQAALDPCWAVQGPGRRGPRSAPAVLWAQLAPGGSSSGHSPHTLEARGGGQAGNGAAGLAGPLRLPTLASSQLVHRGQGVQRTWAPWSEPWAETMMPTHRGQSHGSAVRRKGPSSAARWTFLEDAVPTAGEDAERQLLAPVLTCGAGGEGCPGGAGMQDKRARGRRRWTGWTSSAELRAVASRVLGRSQALQPQSGHGQAARRKVCGRACLAPASIPGVHQLQAAGLTHAQLYHKAMSKHRTSSSRRALHRLRFIGHSCHRCTCLWGSRQNPTDPLRPGSSMCPCSWPQPPRVHSRGHSWAWGQGPARVCSHLPQWLGLLPSDSP